MRQLSSARDRLLLRRVDGEIVAPLLRQRGLSGCSPNGPKR